MFSSPIVISEAPIPLPKEKGKQHNYHAENHGTSASGALGEELPRNIQDLLKGYFTAKKTTVVPPEIYCIQSHRVYTTIDGKKAVYRCHQTGEHIEVRAYSLPSMKQKNNHRLLVAVGRALAKPIVLARTKPHSNKFREWLGAVDDGTTAPVISRSIPDHGIKVENKRQKISTEADVANRLKVVFKKEDEADSHDFGEDLNPVQMHDDTIVVDHGAREPVGQSTERGVTRNRLAYSIEDDDEDTTESSPQLVSHNGHASSPLSTSPQSRKFVGSAQQRHARNKGCTTPMLSTPRMPDISSDLLPQTTPTVAENTIFYFISALTGEKVRKRALAKVDNVELLFTHAYAADVIPINSKVKKLAALEVRVGDFGEAIRIVDDEDFGDLVDAIVREDCWEQGDSNQRNLLWPRTIPPQLLQLLLAADYHRRDPKLSEITLQLDPVRACNSHATGKAYEFRLVSTGEQLEIKTYRAWGEIFTERPPWGPLISDGILVARGPSLPEPVILAKRKKGPHREMSVWKGRQGLDDSLKVKKCYAGGWDTRPGRGKIRSSGAGDDEYRGDKTPDRPSQHRNPPQKFSTAGTQVIEAQPDQNILSPSPEEDIRQSADVDTYDLGLHANLGDKGQNTRVQVPGLVIDELDRIGTRDMPIEITDVKTESDDDDDRTITNALASDQNEYSNFSADRTKFIFRDATNRIVSEADFPSCNNVSRLFMKARLARIISLNRRDTIISARINTIVDVAVGYGDNESFAILMHCIKSHPCWKTRGEEGSCIVEIRDSGIGD